MRDYAQPGSAQETSDWQPAAAEITAADQLRAIRDLIPMDYLIQRDVPGAMGPTAKLDLVGAMRDFSQARWRLIDRVKKAEADRAAAIQAAWDAVNACGGTYTAEEQASGYADGHGEALDAALAAITKLIEGAQ